MSTTIDALAEAHRRKLEQDVRESQSLIDALLAADAADGRPVLATVPALTLKMVPVSPFYRLNWADGTSFDYSNDEAALMREIARVSPSDAVGYQQFLQYSAGVYAKGYEQLGHVAFLDFASMVKAAPQPGRSAA